MHLSLSIDWPTDCYVSCKQLCTNKGLLMRTAVFGVSTAKKLFAYAQYVSPLWSLLLPHAIQYIVHQIISEMEAQYSNDKINIEVGYHKISVSRRSILSGSATSKSHIYFTQLRPIIIAYCCPLCFPSHGGTASENTQNSQMPAHTEYYALVVWPIFLRVVCLLAHRLPTRKNIQQYYTLIC